MRTAIPFHVVHLRNRLLSQLSPPMQFWVSQQAQQIVRSRRFGLWEEMRLNEAIRQKFSQTSPPASAELAAVTSILSFLALNDAIASIEEKLNTVGDDSQLANIELQNVLQKQQQCVQMISNISKMMQDTAMGVIRKIGG
jgi:hypothetical protein